MAEFGKTIFAAIAFAGAGTLFQMIDRKGYAEEVKRHNRAIEAINKRAELLREKETKKLDRQERYSRELASARRDVNYTSKNLDVYRQAVEKDDPLTAYGNIRNIGISKYFDGQFLTAEERKQKERDAKFRIPEIYIVLGYIILILVIILVVYIVYVTI